MFKSSWKNILHASLLQPFISANSCKKSEVQSETLTTAKTICQSTKLNTNRWQGKQPWNNDQPQQPTTTSRHNDHNNHNATAGNDHPNMGNNDTTVGNSHKQWQPTTTTWHNDSNNYNTTVGSDTNATTNCNRKTQQPQQPCGNCRKWWHNCRK